MNRLAKWVKGLLFPRKCILCSRFLGKEEMDLCGSCRRESPFFPYGVKNPPPNGKIPMQFLDSFTAVWYYEGGVRRSIHRLKFGNASNLAPGLGRMLAERILEQEQPFDVFTWVPVSKRRRQKRGYDQCELLARSAGEALGWEPVGVLHKLRDNPPQSRIASPEKRKANVLGVYAVKPGVDLRGKRILLLDDVVTTGATMNECARTLLAAGAKEVHSAAIAAVFYRKK